MKSNNHLTTMYIMPYIPATNINGNANNIADPTITINISPIKISVNLPILM